MLEFKKVYQNNNGEKVIIVGRTKDHPEYAWSLSGNWYEISTGKFVCFDRLACKHYVLDKVCLSDINMAIQPEDWDADAN